MSARGSLVLVILVATLGWTSGNPPRSHDSGYTVVHTFPHDPGAFTQGLVYVDGHLYESTGWVRGPDLPPGYGPDRTYSLDIDP